MGSYPDHVDPKSTRVIKGFYGQTTGFKKRVLKPEVVVMAENKEINEAKIYTVFSAKASGLSTVARPGDYQHTVGEEPTDLTLHPNSPGYRLILNNILFPAARKKKQKT